MEEYFNRLVTGTSKSRIKNLSVLYLALCFAFIQGCNPTGPTSNQNTFGEEIRLSRIDISQGGIIGDYNFYQSYPRFMDDAVKAVGALSLYNAEGPEGPEYIGSGVGIHLHETDLDFDYILTAAHVIYDSKTGKKKGDAIRFGQIGDGQKVISQKISRVPNEHKNFIRGDWVLIPINKTKERAPLDIKFRSNYFTPNENLDEKYNGYFISISSTNGEKLTEPVRFVQKADNLYFEKNEGYVYSDLDAIKGLSGSPVFFVSDRKLQLIGVISRGSPVENCDEITSNKYCGNGIALLPAIQKNGSP